MAGTVLHMLASLFCVGAQFGLGAAVTPLVGAPGNGALALSVVMTLGVMVALSALPAVGLRRGEATVDYIVPTAVVEPA